MKRLPFVAALYALVIPLITFAANESDKIEGYIDTPLFTGANGMCMIPPGLTSCHPSRHLQHLTIRDSPLPMQSFSTMAMTFQVAKRKDRHGGE